MEQIINIFRQKKQDDDLAGMKLDKLQEAHRQKMEQQKQQQQQKMQQQQQQHQQKLGLQRQQAQQAQAKGNTDGAAGTEGT